MQKTGGFFTPMVVGFKYCGGCNPGYDRVAAVEKYILLNPENEYTYDKSRACDRWFVVCGCQAVCASEKELDGKEIIRVCKSDFK